MAMYLIDYNIIDKIRNYLYIYWYRSNVFHWIQTHLFKISSVLTFDSSLPYPSCLTSACRTNAAPATLQSREPWLHFTDTLANVMVYHIITYVLHDLLITINLTILDFDSTCIQKWTPPLKICLLGIYGCAWTQASWCVLKHVSKCMIHINNVN